MKLGVALSGCDLGGLAANQVLEGLGRAGLQPEAVCACCIPAVSALLYNYGGNAALAGSFLEGTERNGLSAAVKELDTCLTVGPEPGKSLLMLGSVDVSDGAVVGFSNHFSMRSQRMSVGELSDVEGALLATLAPAEGLTARTLEGRRLCDYTVWHGIPVHPLRMLGMDRVLSIAFLPAVPRTPHEALVSRMIEQTAGTADAHLTIAFPPEKTHIAEMEEIAISVLENCMDSLCKKLLSI